METARQVKKKARAGLSNPTEVAREALRLLAARRIAPTPENYRGLYHEITGLDASAEEQSGNEQLRNLARKLARLDRASAESARLINDALDERNWGQARAALVELATLRLAQGSARPGEPLPEKEDTQAKAWVRLLKDILAHIAPSHAEDALQSKLRALDQILAAPPATALELHARAANLVKSWPVASFEPEMRTAIAQNVSPLHETLARILESSIIVHISETEDLVGEARAFARRLRAETDEARLRKLGGELRQFVRRLESQADNSAEITSGLLRLLRLLVDNAGELVVDDSWISGQIEVVRGIVERPNCLPMIQDAEQRLRQVLLRQGVIKNGIREAQSTLKAMVAEFIDQLGSVSEHTGDYGNKVETYSERLRRAEGIEGLNGVLAELLDDTRAMREFARRSRDELLVARTRACEAEQRIQQLENELRSVSEKVREDPLTGTLNRRGFDEAFARESARAQRREAPMGLALLDVDDFKRINDVHGHRIGDGALRHLASVVRDTVRPNDIVARFGGEEFMILFPDTEVGEAVNVVVRLQRSLTKRFFLHNNDKLLITFSAGVALWAPAEPQDSVIARADQALYRAKKAGKNRVFEAEPATPHPK